ncbi:hypothetical protein NDU88_004774 [Pleurodeles waltl]|uniref:AP-1 complex subunit sigma-2 n=1 Tax=Pleurodeles waltl TaxID=8319 RepID=A0AAV7NLZ0_PLEWA|nr:hypothetical protein NDU88_004774 [Pleurodeles waltl]
MEERHKMQFMLLFSRQGKLRLQKWYVPLSDKEKKKITRELVQTVLARKPKMCSFLEWRDLKIVYKRYASLYFCCAIEDQDNELITLEIIHRYVELLDKYFGSVCELDIIFNFEKAYFILDEFLLGGEVQETSKKNVLKAIEQADLLQEGVDLNNVNGQGKQHCTFGYGEWNRLFYDNMEFALRTCCFKAISTLDGESQNSAGYYDISCLLTT